MCECVDVSLCVLMCECTYVHVYGMMYNHVTVVCI